MVDTSALCGVNLRVRVSARQTVRLHLNIDQSLTS